jgi:hypothetical protein
MTADHVYRRARCRQLRANPCFEVKYNSASLRRCINRGVSVSEHRRSEGGLRSLKFQKVTPHAPPARSRLSVIASARVAVPNKLATRS